MERNGGSCWLDGSLQRDAGWRNDSNRSLEDTPYGIDEMIDDGCPVSDAARIARSHSDAEPALLLALVFREGAYLRRKEVTVSGCPQPPRLCDLASTYVRRPLVAAVGQD